MMRGVLVCGLMLVPCVAGAQTAGVFTDRDAWLAAAGSVDFVETFDGFTQDVSFQDAPVRLNNGLTLSATPGTQLLRIIDVEEFVVTFGDGVPYTTDPAVIAGTERTSAGDRETVIEFDVAMTAFGFDIFGFSASSALSVVAFNGDDPLGSFLIGSLPVDTFVGFVADDEHSITSVRLMPAQTRSRLVVLDNLSGVFVPGPGAGVVLAAAGVLAARRRRG